jgi:tight adherence protein B
VQRLIPPPLQQEVELAVKEMRVGGTLSTNRALRSRPHRQPPGGLGVRRSSPAGQIGGSLPKILDTAAASLREISRLEGVACDKPPRVAPRAASRRDAAPCRSSSIAAPSNQLTSSR